MAQTISFDGFKIVVQLGMGRYEKAIEGFCLIEIMLSLIIISMLISIIWSFFTMVSNL